MAFGLNKARSLLLTAGVALHLLLLREPSTLAEFEGLEAVAFVVAPVQLFVISVLLFIVPEPQASRILMLGLMWVLFVCHHYFMFGQEIKDQLNRMSSDAAKVITPTFDKLLADFWGLIWDLLGKRLASSFSHLAALVWGSMRLFCQMHLIAVVFLAWMQEFAIYFCDLSFVVPLYLGHRLQRFIRDNF